MTDIVCITCAGRGTVNKTQAATSTKEPGRMFTQYTKQHCTNCDGTGRVPVNK